MTEGVLGPGAVVTDRTTNWPMIWVTSAVIVPLLAMAAPSRAELTAPAFLVPVAIAVLAIVVNVVTLSSLRTTAGPRGVTAHFGVFGWPRFRYPIASISQVVTTDVKPSSQLAWGLTWSPRRGLTLALRNGRAVKLTLRNGRTVTVGVRDAGEVVRVLAQAGCPTTD